MKAVVIVLAIVAVVAVIVWFVTTRRHPDAASDLGVHTDGSPRQASTNDRPAGPSVDADDIDRAVTGDSMPSRPVRATDVDGNRRDTGEEGRA